MLPLEVQRVDSPLRCHYRAWQAALKFHPDQVFAAYILQGIWQGFRVGFNREQHPVPARRNTPSAGEHADVVEQYLSKEISAGRISGPFPIGTVRGLQINRMGVIPKGHTPGKWRLITALAFPPLASVNDGIDRELSSLQYTSVEKVARAAQRLGKGALLGKLDVQAAYRLIPVHPEDRLLLGSDGAMQITSTGGSHLA